MSAAARALLLAAGAALGAAERPAFLGYVFPAGGAPGATVAVVCAGDGLGGTSVVAVGGAPGVTARIVDAGTPPAEMKLGRKKGAAVLDEQVALELAIAPDAAPGLRTIALRTPRGITNLRRFQVSPLPALREREPNERAKDQPELALPCTVDGQIQSGDADGFRFRLGAGERLRARCDARLLIPFIADAVPGWCQAVLVLSDDAGRELLTVDDSGGSPDPLLEWTAPREGRYRLTVRDAIWRGRADFVYRLHLDHGGNPEPAAGPGSVDLAARPGGVTELSPPAVVGGRLAAPGQEDRFAFTAAAGTPIAIEAWAQRLGSPLDLRLVLLGPGGATVAACDDRVDPADGERTWHADPGLLATLPRDGRYLLRLHCVQDRTGPYRLRLGPPQPRSEVLATPAAIALAPGGSAEVVLHAVRRDGDSRALAVTCDPPLRLDGGTIPAGAERVRATLTAPPDAAGVLRPVLRVGGQAVQPAEDQMQAFLWRHLVPQPGLLAVVDGEPATRVEAVVPEGGLALPAGKETAITVVAHRRSGRDGPIQLALRDPPAGISLRKGRIDEGADRGQITVRVNATVAPMDTTLIIEAALLLDPPPAPAAAASAPAATGAAAKPPPRPRQHLLLPALPVRIVKGKA